MKINGIKARNYKTLEDIALHFNSDYCTISGKNNAGKSAIITLLGFLFQKQTAHTWMGDPNRIDFKEDRTQWKKGNDPIIVEYELTISNHDDSALITFIHKMTNKDMQGEDCKLKIILSVDPSDNVAKEVILNGEKVDPTSAKEISQKLTRSNLLFLHNSASHHEELFYASGRPRSFIELVLSEDEQKKLDVASRTVRNKMKQLAKEHKEELANLLGRLSDKYDVEFSAFEGSYARRIPFSINLSDRSVEVPINDWGSGTQNRTLIFMSILQANRIRTKVEESDRITPIVVIEEPESFLHPSAQSEFGKTLQTISKDLKIQIIATTHSPYMLNQECPESNILLKRHVYRNKLMETMRVDTTGQCWMAPFAENLGLKNEEFDSWKNLFTTRKSHVLMVEGEIDKSYFEYLREKKIGTEQLSPEIEIVPYGGKDTLKNSLLLKFVMSKFDKFFITFDYDCMQEITSCLLKLGLSEDKDYLPIGIQQAGKDAIEGLLPQRIISAVASSETDLVLQASSTASARKKARDELKQKFLEEFKKHSDYTDTELKEFTKVIKIINKAFKS